MSSVRFHKFFLEGMNDIDENISKTKKKIVKVKKSIFDKSKIEDLAKKSGIVSR